MPKHKKVTKYVYAFDDGNAKVIPAAFIETNKEFRLIAGQQHERTILQGIGYSRTLFKRYKGGVYGKVFDSFIEARNHAIQESKRRLANAEAVVAAKWKELKAWESLDSN